MLFKFLYELTDVLDSSLCLAVNSRGTEAGIFWRARSVRTNRSAFFERGFQTDSYTVLRVYSLSAVLHRIMTR
jgi:hypothetical protein